MLEYDYIKNIRAFLLRNNECGQDYCIDLCALCDELVERHYKELLTEKVINPQEKDFAHQPFFDYKPKYDYGTNPRIFNLMRRFIARQRLNDLDEMTLASMTDLECVKIVEENGYIPVRVQEVNKVPSYYLTKGVSKLVKVY